jgi:hypothetical protein
MTALSVMVFTAAKRVPAAENYPVWSPMKGVDPAGAVQMAAASACFVHLSYPSKTNNSVDKNMTLLFVFPPFSSFF